MYHVQTIETIHTPDESHGRSDMGLVKGLATGGVNIQEFLPQGQTVTTWG